MEQNLSDLSGDVQPLRGMIAAQALQLAKRDSLIDKLMAQLAGAQTSTVWRVV